VNVAVHLTVRSDSRGATTGPQLTHRSNNTAIRYVEVALRDLQLAMPEQHLDLADVFRSF
jgi:hypothetical protein